MALFLLKLMNAVKDESIFLVLEFCLIMAFFYATYKVSKRKREIVTKVKREDISWGYLSIAYAMLSFILIQIIDEVDFIRGYKVTIILANLFIALYLCFVNGWSRNKIVGLFSKYKNLEERF